MIVVAAGSASAESLVGLASLGLGHPPRVAVAMTSCVAGALGGGVATAAAHQSGSLWWLPSLLAWAIGLTAMATCDGFTQRIPISLVRFTATVTAALLVVGAVGTRDWHACLTTLLSVLISTLLLTACWRFAGAGFGDVRLAAIGGLGLGHATSAGLLLGVIAFTTSLGAQALVTFSASRDRHANIPLGPALVLGFLVAAAA